MKPLLIVHGHFYQPPRENPWTSIVEREPSAAPARDWNERIYRESYRANAYARIYDDRGAVVGIVNNYRHISFNFGPTLEGWLEREHPRTWRRILEADQQSALVRGGHGNALAQAYNHSILPLSNERDIRTQIRWGLADFRVRFGRDAEGMWLPETACDRRVLGALIDEGLRFAILAPEQVARIKLGDAWRDVTGVDPRRPYRYVHPDGSGRSIAIFFYDGPLSRAIAFEGLLSSSRALVDRFERASDGPGTVVQAVTDGETYGHHFRHGERCLAYALEEEAGRRGFQVTNYGELLDHVAPVADVDIALGADGKGSAWSCSHGVGRWYRDCGCNAGGKPGWTQSWRTPLRLALDVLRDGAIASFERSMDELGLSPWAARDAYIELLLDPRASRADFFERYGTRRLDDDDRLRALRLLESQRSAMTMYTSCGWFFSDLSGIETRQVLRYAGRLVDQLRELEEPDHEARFLEQLAEAKSNIAERGNGADLYRAATKSSRTTARTTAAHVAIRRLVDGEGTRGRAGRFSYDVGDEHAGERGRMLLEVARVRLVEDETAHESEFATCAVHFGGVDLHCLVRPFEGLSSFRLRARQILDSLRKDSLLTVFRIAEEQLGPEDFGIEHVLPGEREELSRVIFAELSERYAAHLDAMFTDGHHTMLTFHEAGLPIPAEVRAAAELALGRRITEAIVALPSEVFEPDAYRQVLAIATEARALGCRVALEPVKRHLERVLHARLLSLAGGMPALTAHAAKCASADGLALVRVADRLGVELELERGQELVFQGLARGLGATTELAELCEELGLSQKLLPTA